MNIAVEMHAVRLLLTNYIFINIKIKHVYVCVSYTSRLGAHRRHSVHVYNCERAI